MGALATAKFVCKLKEAMRETEQLIFLPDVNDPLNRPLSRVSSVAESIAGGRMLTTRHIPVVCLCMPGGSLVPSEFGKKSVAPSGLAS